MKTWYRSGHFAMLPGGLGLIALVALGAWAAENGPAVKVSAASAAQQAGKWPHLVLILRHGEKPDDDSDVHLTSRGAARAAALPSLFVAPPTFPTKPAPFPTPGVIFAAKASKKSNRPVETVTPLAKALGDMHIHAKHRDDDYQALVEHIFSERAYAGKTILVCWHHGNIPKLTLALVKMAKNGDEIRDQVPGRWKGSVFDRVWVIRFDGQGRATFANQPQRLLFQDSKD